LASFFSKFIKKFKTKSSLPLPGDKNFFKTLRQIILASGSKVTQPYKESIWVYSCVNTIADNISRVPFRIYNKVKGSPQQNLSRNEVTSGELYELFSTPNPLSTFRMLMVATITYLELEGEAFWVLDGRKGPDSIPTEIWCLNPSRFQAITDKKTGHLEGWEYRVTPDSDPVILKLDDVLYFRYFNPYDDIKGQSSLSAAQLSIDQDYYASRHNKNFFREGAVMSGIIEYPDELSDDTFNRLMKQFEDRHKGYQKAHKIGIIDGGGTWKDIGTRPKDLDFVNLKNIIKSEIFSAFKTNEVVLGIFENIQSYEGSRAAHRAFWQETLIPKISYIEEVVNKRFLNKLGYEGEFDLGTVEALRDDFNYKVQSAWLLYRMGYPINMINKRLKLGMDDVKWGDIAWMPSSQIPVDGDSSGKDDTDNNAKSKSDAKQQAKILKPELSRLRENCWIVEKRFQSKLSRFLFEQRQAVIETLYLVAGDWKIMTSSRMIDKIFPSKETDRLRNMLEPLYTTGVKLGAESIASEMGDIDFVFKDTDFEHVVNARLNIIPSELVFTVKTQLNQALIEGVDDGDTVEELIGRVKKVYNFAATKAKQISKTEAIGSVNLARYFGMKKYGVEKHKWLYLGDGKHGFLNNKSAKIGSSFISGENLKYPCDLDYNDVSGCTCLTVPILKGGEI
jgi:HK97 family phage portal protein